MPKSNRNGFFIMLAILGVIGAVIIGAYFRMSGPADEYANHAPPPGPNARPDRPDPSKAGRVPHGASMGH